MCDQIHLHSEVKFNYHTSDLDEIHACLTFYTEFRENPGNILVVDTRSQTGGRSIHKTCSVCFFFYFITTARQQKYCSCAYFNVYMFYQNTGRRKILLPRSFQRVIFSLVQDR
jgi:hypothetical protein